MASIFSQGEHQQLFQHGFEALIRSGVKISKGRGTNSSRGSWQAPSKASIDVQGVHQSCHLHRFVAVINSGVNTSHEQSSTEWISQRFKAGISSCVNMGSRQ